MKKQYKEQPQYKAVYGIEANFHQRFVLMSMNILKQTQKLLLSGNIKTK